MKERLGPVVLVEAHPTTGRTHQIRVHLQAIGFPIIGDQFYGGAEPLLLSSFKRNYQPNRHKNERPLIDRLALHASKLTLKHPETGIKMTFEAPYAKDFSSTIKQLRKVFGK